MKNGIKFKVTADAPYNEKESSNGNDGKVIYACA